jgi:hypothetical protein
MKIATSAPAPKNIIHPMGPKSQNRTSSFASASKSNRPAIINSVYMAAPSGSLVKLPGPSDVLPVRFIASSDR